MPRPVVVSSGTSRHQASDVRKPLPLFTNSHLKAKAPTLSRNPRNGSDATDEQATKDFFFESEPENCVSTQLEACLSFRNRAVFVYSCSEISRGSSASRSCWPEVAFLQHVA